jgi:hypothetical protein
MRNVIKERGENYLQQIQKAYLDPAGFGLRYRSTNWHSKDNWE